MDVKRGAQMKTFSDFGINTNGKTGEIKTLCPKCSAERKKKNDKCLNVNIDKGVWHCWNCDWAGCLKDGEYLAPKIIIRPKVYTKPKEEVKGLSEFWFNWLAKRGITKQVIERNKLFNTEIYMPQVEDESDSLCFPYFRKGEKINIKYRNKQKNFRMHAGAERILYGMDDISNDCLIWCEGEIDKLSLEVAGFKSVVSVPDGAPSPNTKDFSKKFDYLEQIQDILLGVKVHILAVDNDAPGKTLETELVRRLGAEKCKLVHFPDGCKDSNDVLVKHGANDLAIIIKNAHDYPIEGIVTVENAYEAVFDKYQNGSQHGMTIDLAEFDNYYSVRPCEWTVITGIPGSGKSEFVDFLLISLAMKYGLKFAVCSPENQPIQNHIQKLAEKFAGKLFYGSNKMQESELMQAMDFLNKHFFFILPEDMNLENILDKTNSLVKSKGVNGLIIDPWNEIETEQPYGMSETQYIGKCLTKIRKFTRQNIIHTWIVAHPTKMERDKKGFFQVPTAYDIAGSANWRNKADNIICVHRPDMRATRTEIYIQKIRFKDVGKVGKTELNYDLNTTQYSQGY